MKSVKFLFPEKTVWIFNEYSFHQKEWKVSWGFHFYVKQITFRIILNKQTKFLFKYLRRLFSSSLFASFLRPTQSWKTSEFSPIIVGRISGAPRIFQHQVQSSTDLIPRNTTAAVLIASFTITTRGLQFTIQKPLYRIWNHPHHLPFSTSLQEDPRHLTTTED